MASEKEIPLFIGDGEFQFFHDLEEVFPDHAFGAFGFVVKDVGGVESGHQGDAFVFVPGSVNFSYFEGVIMAQQSSDGCISQGDEDFGLNDGDLSIEIGQREIHFLGRRGTVS